MKSTLSGAAILMACATGVHAGAIDRSRTDTSLLFEEGNRLKFSYTYVTPDIKGKYSQAFGPAAGASTGDMAESFSNFAFGLKQQINDQWAIALLADTPYGADASYHKGPYTGLNATWDSEAVTFLAHYRINERFSIYAGPRAVRSEADVGIPGVLLAGARYKGKVDKQVDFGGLIGFAYEIPDIALRVSLTYQSEIEHKFNSRETFVGTGISLDSTTKVKLPQTVTLDFRSGIAAETLIFGSVRWSDWSKYDVSPDLFLGATGLAVADVQDDVWSFSLGVARRLNENLSVFARGGFEPKNNSTVSRLAPTDGRWSAGVGGTYTINTTKITAGVEYFDIGSAEDSAGTKFSGGEALALGISVSYGF
jgi:long-subunit fatty acid transport protein